MSAFSNCFVPFVLVLMQKHPGSPQCDLTCQVVLFVGHILLGPIVLIQERFGTGF